VIVNPAHVFGRGDRYGSSTILVRRFLRRQIPAYVDGALNIVDAEDVAAGHLLADERGEVGERYILGNRNFTLDRLFADLGGCRGSSRPRSSCRSPRRSRSRSPSRRRRPAAHHDG
jgi:dihydroflavonol-4-reductase